MKNLSLLLITTAALFSGSLATCPWWEVLFPLAPWSWGLTPPPALETCQEFFQQVSTLFGDLHRYDPNRRSPPFSPEHLAGFFKKNWGTICNSVQDSARDCIGSVIENIGCDDDDHIFDYDAFPEKFMKEAPIPLPARPILRNVTVADVRRYVTVATKMLAEVCRDPQPWFRSVIGWTETFECVKNTFAPIRPERTTTTFSYNYTGYNHPYYYERPVMPFALAQLTYELARLGTVQWFNGGQPLSSVSCDILSEATWAILNIPSDPTCDGLVTTFSAAFDTLKDEACESHGSGGNEANNRGLAKTARMQLDMEIDMYSGTVKRAKLVRKHHKRKPLRRRWSS